MTMMKNYDELTPEQQSKARARCLSDILEAVCAGALVFDDKKLQRRIETAAERMEINRTPWFMAEAVMETCGDMLRKIALSEAERALYSEPNELVLIGIIEK